MKSKKVFGVLCLLSAMLMSISNVSAAQKAEPGIPLASAGEKFIAEYSDMLTALKAEIIKSVPRIDEKESAGFLGAYASESGTKSAENAVEALDKAQTKTLAAAKPILADLEKFLTGDRLDAKLVKCAVLANATPRGLAEFAQQGKEQKALIDKLLSDTVLMNQHLLVTPNNAGASIDIALPYTVGMWEDTKPVEIELAKGKNVLHFTRDIPNYGLTIKHFTLTPAM
jgi:hypothetical protein